MIGQRESLFSELRHKVRGRFIHAPVDKVLYQLSYGAPKLFETVRG